MTDIHAAIRDFLQQQAIVPLGAGGEREHFTKAGVVPFLREGGWRFYVMKPQGRLPGMGVPEFQLCKGTRMYRVPGAGWRDMREETQAGDRESLAETALREGIEELGLSLSNINALFEMGPYNFTSATTGKPKRMWPFSAEMREAEDFLPERDVALTTAARAWLSCAEFAVAGRADHRYILKDMEEKLTHHFARHPEER